MKKVMLFSLLLAFVFSSTAHALSWAYPFVVWDGKLYEVKQEGIVPENDIAEAIGQVKTAADDMTGDYYGNASNYYEKGTVYYALKGVSPDEAIAVDADGVYVKAVYIQKAAFHFMNVLTAFWLWAILALVAFSTFYFYMRSNRSKT